MRDEVLKLVKELQDRLAVATGAERERLQLCDTRARDLFLWSQTATTESEFLARLEALRDVIRVCLNWTDEAFEAEETKLRDLIKKYGLDYGPAGWVVCVHTTEEVELNWNEEINPDYPFSIADDHTRIYLESFEHARKELEAVVEHHKIRAEEVAEELRQAEQEATWMEEEEAAVEEED